MNPDSRPAQSSQQGVVLVEALVAILLFSIGVLAVAGLQATMVKNTSESKFRADAAYVAQKRIGELWTAPNGLPADGGPPSSSAAAALPNGQVIVARSGVQYTVTVTWQQPGQAPHSFTTVASITTL